MILPLGGQPATRMGKLVHASWRSRYLVHTYVVIHLHRDALEPCCSVKTAAEHPRILPLARRTCAEATFAQHLQTDRNQAFVSEVYFVSLNDKIVHAHRKELSSRSKKSENSNGKLTSTLCSLSTASQREGQVALHVFVGPPRTIGAAKYVEASRHRAGSGTIVPRS